MGDDALFNLRWDAQRSALLGSVASLFREEAFVDTTVVADGQIFKAHKLLLSASSSYLKHILESVPSQHAVLFMPHINSSDLGNVLKFIYEGEIKINRRSLKSFLGVAKLLKIKGMDFELDEDLETSIPSAPPATLLQTAATGSSKRSSTAPASVKPETPQSEDDTSASNNIPSTRKHLSTSLKQETKTLPPHDNSEYNHVNQNSNPNNVDNRSRHANGNSLSVENPSVGSSSNSSNHNQQNQHGKPSSNINQSEGSQGGSRGGSVSDMEMAMLDDSNHSNNESHPLMTLPDHLVDSDGINLDEHDEGEEHNDHDPNMENDMDNDYDDDEDQNFSISMKPEVSFRESDESFNVLDRHQPIHIKSVQSMNSFGGSHSNNSTTGSASASSQMQQHGVSLKNAHKLRTLVPKSLHHSGQGSSQLQNINEGILMRMMREPLHSSSIKPNPSNSSTLANYFELGHTDSNHPAGLRKQKRYVQCTSCSKVLSSLSALKRHMEDVHCARIQGKCIICGRVYSSRNSLLTHVYSAHKKHHDYKAVARIIRESDFEQFATA